MLVACLFYVELSVSNLVYACLLATYGIGLSVFGHAHRPFTSLLPGPRTVVSWLAYGAHILLLIRFVPENNWILLAIGIAAVGASIYGLQRSDLSAAQSCECLK